MNQSVVWKRLCLPVCRLEKALSTSLSSGKALPTSTLAVYHLQMVAIRHGETNTMKRTRRFRLLGSVAPLGFYRYVVIN